MPNPLSKSLARSALRPALLVVDVQERLLTAFPATTCRELLPRLGLMLAAARAMALPVVIAEQYPQGLGHTLPQLREQADPAWPVIAKTSFSCFGEPALVAALPPNCDLLAIVGVETHVCVQQTALDALAAGIPRVIVAADAVASRHAADHDRALALMAGEGIRISSVEAIVFMLLRTSRHPAFKAVSALIRQLDAARD